MALASPFGTFRVPNISPDPIDGIGRWRTIDLANALMRAAWSAVLQDTRVMLLDLLVEVDDGVLEDAA